MGIYTKKVCDQKHIIIIKSYNEPGNPLNFFLYLMFHLMRVLMIKIIPKLNNYEKVYKMTSASARPSSLSGSISRCQRILRHSSNPSAEPSEETSLLKLLSGTLQVFRIGSTKTHNAVSNSEKSSIKYSRSTSKSYFTCSTPSLPKKNSRLRVYVAVKNNFRKKLTWTW